MGFAKGTPTASITLDDKSYTLGFTLNAMRRAKELGVLEVDATDETALMLALPEYVWACMETEDRKALTVEQVGELMNPLNVKAIAEAVGQLFKASLPDVPEGNGTPATRSPATAGESTSINSGHLAATT